MIVLLIACQNVSMSSSQEIPEIQSSASNISQAETELSVTGIVKDASMNFVIILTDDNKEYSFFTSEADKSRIKNGLMLGNRITVFYTEQSDYPNSYTATRLQD